MANALLDPTIITRQSLVEFKNAMVLLDGVDRQLDSEFENKIGDTVNVRKRVRYISIAGPDITSQIQDTVEGNIPVTLAFQRTVPIEFSSQELTLTIEEFSDRYIRPAMIELVQDVESEIALQYKKLWWFTGSPGTAPSTFLDIGTAGAILDKAAVPFDRRSIYYEPSAALTLADGLKNVFPTTIAKRAIEEASIGRYTGFNVIKSQSIQTHTVGNYGGTPLVNGASQVSLYPAVKDDNRQDLITDGWDVSVTGLLLEGDIITIADVFSVNPRTRTTTGDLQTFTIRSDVNSDGGGNATLSISPAIITSGSQQTVDSAPADGAAIEILTGVANSQHPQNIGWHPNAVTVAFAQLVMPIDGSLSSRETMDNVSVRMVGKYDILKDTNIWRFDILFGVEAQNPGMGVRHTS